MCYSVVAYNSSPALVNTKGESANNFGSRDINFNFHPRTNSAQDSSYQLVHSPNHSAYSSVNSNYLQSIKAKPLSKDMTGFAARGFLGARWASDFSGFHHIRMNTHSGRDERMESVRVSPMNRKKKIMKDMSNKGIRREGNYNKRSTSEERDKNISHSSAKSNQVLDINHKAYNGHVKNIAPKINRFYDKDIHSYKRQIYAKTNGDITPNQRNANNNISPILDSPSEPAGIFTNGTLLNDRRVRKRDQLIENESKSLHSKHGSHSIRNNQRADKMHRRETTRTETDTLPRRKSSTTENVEFDHFETKHVSSILYDEEFIHRNTIKSCIDHKKSLSLCKAGLDQIPEAVFDIKDLDTLNLRGNDIVNVPSKICKLGRLSSLHLEKNKIQYIPNELSSMSCLRNLNVNENNIGRLPVYFCSLKNLQELHIGWNGLSYLPTELHHLINLQVLDLRGNAFLEFPKCVLKLTNLSNLDFGWNCLEKLPEDIGNLGNLTKLGLHHNKLESLPESMNRLQLLQHLYLRGNLFSDLPAVVGELVALSTLDLSDNNIMCSVPIAKRPDALVGDIPIFILL